LFGPCRRGDLKFCFSTRPIARLARGPLLSVGTQRVFLGDEFFTDFTQGHACRLGPGCRFLPDLLCPDLRPDVTGRAQVLPCYAARRRGPRFSREGLGQAFVARGHGLPVHRVPPVVHILRTPGLVLQVVGVLPDVWAHPVALGAWHAPGRA
jgi:hypothetical protein